jgi:Ca2+-binding EF-hand superfamily protein
MSHLLVIRRLPMLLAAMSICLTGVAWAAPATDRFPISIAELQAKAAKRFAEIDSDQSGNIDATEFEAANMRRHHPDEKRGERQRHGAGHRKHHRDGATGDGHRAEMQAAMQTDLFNILDTDGDGNLSRAEFTANNQHKARQQAHEQAVFKGLDRDGDNLLSADEFPRSLARLSGADADSDGLITKAEMKAFRIASRSTRQAETR